MTRKFLTLTLLSAALLAGCSGKDDTDDDATQRPQDQGSQDQGGTDQGTDSALTDTGITAVDTSDAGTGDLGDGGQLDTSTGSFDCGDKTCLVAYEYCYTTLSGTKDSGGGDGSEYSCELTPDACLPEPTCGCLTTSGAIDGMVEQCTADGDGNLFVELALP